MPVPMQQQIPPQANPNLQPMQRQYPPAPYPNPAAPPVSASLNAFPPGRPRDWEPPDQRAAIERETKRARPYQPPPNDPSYINQQAALNRNLPMAIPPQAQPPAGLVPGQQIPRMPPSNAPAIHPPSHPFVNRPSFAPPVNMPPRGPPGQPRDDYQYPRKPAGQYPNQPPGQMGYDSLPPPPRKDVPPSDRGKGPPTPNSRQSSDSAQRIDEPISFKDFLLRQPDTILPHDAKDKYDLYVRNFTRKKPNKFFNLHKDEEWFKERYDPDYVLQRAERIKEEVKARAGDFKELWDLGGSAICAPDISSGSFDKRHENRDHQAGSPKMDETDVVKAEHDEKKEAEESEKQEPEAMKVEPVTADDTTSEEAKDPKTEEKDEEAVQGSDPEQKPEEKPEAKEEAIKQEDSEDGTTEAKQETSKQESEETKAEAGEVTKAEEKEDMPMSETKTEPSNVDEVTKNSDEQKAEGTESRHDESPQTRSHTDMKSGDYLVLPLRREHQKHTIFMRGIPVNLKRTDLSKALQQGGDGKDLQLRRVKIGDINPMRGLERFAWAVYASEEAAAIALENVRGVVVRSESNKKKADDRQPSTTDGARDDQDQTCVYRIDCMINLQRKKRYTQGRILPSVFGTPERMEHDVKQSTKMMRYLDKLRKLDESLNPLTDDLLNELPSDGSRLDHIVTYLREVHYFCYYSGNEFLEDSTSMPPQELRPRGERLNRNMSESELRVVQRVDDRAKWVLERDYDRPRSNSDSAEVAKEKAVQKWLDSNTKNEGQGRYRCGLPPYKLFKGPAFVHKHLRTKHGDVLQKVMSSAYLDVYRTNFENDPSKDEVISIYNDGIASAQQKSTGGRHQQPAQGRPPQQFGFSQGRSNAPMGMYPTGGFMGMGVQPFPMMMMPSAPGYPGAYTGGYPNAMAAMTGRGMGGMGAQGMNPSMMQMGMQGMEGGAMQGRSHPRTRDGPRDFRDGGHRGGYRGGRRGGYIRRGGDHFRRGHGDGRPLDPRASGPRRTYNDLDAPANGPSFDLVRYDEV